MIAQSFIFWLFWRLIVTWRWDLLVCCWLQLTDFVLLEGLFLTDEETVICLFSLENLLQFLYIVQRNSDFLIKFAFLSLSYLGHLAASSLVKLNLLIRQLSNFVFELSLFLLKFLNHFKEIFAFTLHGPNFVLKLFSLVIILVINSSLLFFLAFE